MQPKQIKHFNPIHIRQRFPSTVLGVFLCLAFIQSTHLAQANDDSKQPVEIIADQLISDEKQGKSEYSGKVDITQGSFNLKGDNVKIAHPANQLKSIYATGNPAKFKQFNTTENAWINGEASEIFYDAQLKTVRLKGNAIVEQENKHQIKGENLLYDMQSQTLQGSGDSKQRIQVTLQPNQDD